MRVRTAGTLVCAGILWSSAIPYGHAQKTTNQTKRLEQYVQAVGKIPAAQQKHLSGGALNLLHYAQGATQKPQLAGTPDGGLRNGNSARPAIELGRMRAANAGLKAKIGVAAGVVPVSNPAQDFTLSLLGGFTQSETSTAWCGNTVVVGYNDSGSYLRTSGIDPSAAASFNGVASSVSGGRSFRALDYLNPGPNPTGFLGGDPVVVCGAPSTFYYSSLFSTTDPSGNPLSAISLSTSFSSGLSWSAPALAAAKDGFSHTLDKDWLAIDFAHPENLYVTYTDFDYSYNSNSCPNESRIAIELVASHNSGSTWSVPVVIDEECGATNAFVQGSQVAVDRTGKVYVAYEFFAADGSRSLKIASSTNRGSSFDATTEISTVTQTGDGSALQGEFRSNEFPSMAIDPASSAVYVAWADARNNVVPDLISGSGTYGYGDVFVSRSDDGGHSWSAAEAVSTTPASYTGVGRDQFMPAIAVDHAGNLAVCYYDRRLDPENQAIDRFCSLSADHGSSWRDSRKTTSSWTPVHGSDVYINPAYLGDYDQTAVDATGANQGFVGAFQIQVAGNPDVFAAKF